MVTLFIKDEEKLMLSFQGGSQSAFNQVFNQLYPAVCFFATRFLNNNFAAEEIVQDVFVKAWHKKEDFQEFRSLKSFLYTSTRNACINHIDKETRKAKRIKAVAASIEDLDQPGIDEMIYAEVLNAVRMEIDNLPEQCGRVIKMLFEEDKKPQEIADELDITVSTVYNQKMRGLSLLKKRLPNANIALLLTMLKLLN